jgi:hypothetical protein
LTIHGDTIPGFTRLLTDWYFFSIFASSTTGSGRGPTIAISPFSTLNNCGSSSKPV